MTWNSLIDRPVETEEDDSLRLRHYAKALGKFIMNCETPLTIGIQGDWGIGKTSLLNMIEERLRPRRGLIKKFPTIYFNTWQYSQFNQEEYLGIAVLNGIISAIEKKFPDNETQKYSKLKEYGTFALKFAGRAASQVVRKQVGIDIESATQQEGDDLSYSKMSDLLENYKKQFSHLVDGLVPSDGSKLVIMVDDLDRVKPVKALELLEAMKNFLDVPKCVFLLAVDYSVVQQGVKEKLGSGTQLSHGKSYFDKIIQVPFNMPTSAYHMDKYIMSLLGWDLKDNSYVKMKSDDGKYFLSVKDKNLDDETVKFFTNITRLTAGTNPRSIKRVVNYVNLLKIVTVQTRKGDNIMWRLEDARFLYALACMQLEWPELFNYFAATPVPATVKKFEDWGYLNDLSELSSMFARYQDKEQLKSNITGFFDELINLIDTNEDGDISINEFRPIWRMMRDANLTSANLEDMDEAWNDIKKRAIKYDSKSGGRWREDIDSIISLLRDSKWNNRVNFKLKPAGQRFYNVLWKDNQVGSIVTTQAEPVQIFLKVPFDKFETNGSVKSFVEHYTRSHYGVGDCKINVRGLTLLPQPEALEILNNIHGLTLESVEESKAPPINDNQNVGSVVAPSQH